MWTTKRTKRADSFFLLDTNSTTLHAEIQAKTQRKLFSSVDFLSLFILKLIEIKVSKMRVGLACLECSTLYLPKYIRVLICRRYA